MAIKSNNPGSPNGPGTSSIPSIAGAPPAGNSGGSGTTSGTNVPGIGPVTVIKPPKGFQKTVQQLAFGASKDLPAGGVLPAAGTQLTQAQILAFLQSVLDGFTAVSDAEKAVKQQRLSLSALLPQARQFVATLKDALIAHFGRGNPILLDFGLKDGSTRRKTTVEAKSAAKVKGQETRKLRNTKGKVQRLEVKFTGQVAPASAVKPGTPGGSGGGTPSGSTGGA